MINGGRLNALLSIATLKYFPGLERNRLVKGIDQLQFFRKLQQISAQTSS